MTLELAPLPFDYDALAPTMSAETLKLHHDKHHAKYVKTANDLIKDTKYADLGLDDLVKAAKKDGETKLFNNAAQIWNHDFFWKSLTPSFAKPGKALLEAIDASFGSYKDFTEAFIKKGEGHFGSGWVWLIASGHKLSLEDTHDADTPVAHGKKAILTCDVWEHAYYVDTKNDRNAYLNGFIDKLANWSFAEKAFAAA